MITTRDREDKYISLGRPTRIHDTKHGVEEYVHFILAARQHK